MRLLFEFLTICVLGVLQFAGLALFLSFFCFLILLFVGLCFVALIVYLILRMVGVDVHGWLDKQLK